MEMLNKISQFYSREILCLEEATLSQLEDDMENLGKYYHKHKDNKK